jgi:hypothetical protein
VPEPLDKALEETERELGIGRHARPFETSEANVLELAVGSLETSGGYDEVHERDRGRRQVKVVVHNREPDDPENSVRLAVYEQDLYGYWQLTPTMWRVDVSVEPVD